MTTANAMLRPTCQRLAPLVLALLAVLTGCVPRRGMVDPVVLAAPYRGDVVWAIAPPRNESGVSTLDTFRIADQLQARATEVAGVTAVPVNRTLTAMRALEMPVIATEADALRLAAHMDVDAILIGTVAQWHPYNPPEFGMGLVLYGRHADRRRSAGAASASVDAEVPEPFLLSTAPSALSPSLLAPQPGTAGSGLLLSAVSGHFDGANAAVRSDIRRYADGRHDRESALGWEGFLKSMARFEEFVCFQLIERLLQSEQRRISEEQAQAAAR